MGKQKTSKNHDKVKNKKQVLVAEFNVPMHCNACERSVAETISQIKGVEKFMTDMPRHKVVVIGQIKPEKIVKKIEKKTGKRAEISQREEDEEGSTKEEKTKKKKKEKKKEKTKEGEEDGLPTTITITTQDYNYLVENYLRFDCILDPQGYTFFSDENPNSCSLM